MRGTSTSALILAFAAVAAPAFLAGAKPAVAAAVDRRVVYLGPASEELKSDAANFGLADDEVWSRADSLFTGITRKTSTEIGPFRLRGWDDPDLSDDNRMGTVEALDKAFETTLAEPADRRQPREVPPPCDEECRRSLRDALATGQGLKSSGRVRFDGEDGKSYLPPAPGVVGAFVYDPTGAIGVFYSQELALIAKFVGDTVAAATAAHEYGHADDHSRGRLDPVRVKDGEVSAFKRQYDYLLKLDPKGEKLAKLRYNLVGKHWVPQIVSDYLEHLATVRLYGEKGDFERLVDLLGYEDRDHNPFHAHGRRQG